MAVISVRGYTGIIAGIKVARYTWRAQGLLKLHHTTQWTRRNLTPVMGLGALMV